MLTVIVDASQGHEGLPALLAQLTAGAVDGIVRQVLIVASADAPDIDLFCEDMGAEAVETLRAGAEAARGERLMILPASLRLRDGWIGALNAHLASGAGEARVDGLKSPGLFGRSESGVLVERRRVLNTQGADLQQLRRDLGFRAGRTG